ncbi:hypothetical protein HPB48_021114 [Haemaphysalis longicornis]|uniref:Uncharacterized protein n=1 Tax=Haemaphysalis longicornis TaxID=44386 RepID=A0A9J6GX08_HAELO|nr:hypothetical protein HPB48_021114 [Haemaphysalis longicornis]
MAIEVHLKRRLLFQPTYRCDLVKKANMKAWLPLVQPHTLALAALNIRSLRKHFVDVTHDPVLGKMQLLCFTET